MPNGASFASFEDEHLLMQWIKKEKVSTFSVIILLHFFFWDIQYKYLLKRLEAIQRNYIYILVVLVRHVV